MRRKSFPSASIIRVGLIRRTGHGVLALVQGCLVAVGYRWSHPDRWIRLTPDHRCRRRMLANWSQNWNHQNWSHAIFNDESMVSPYHSDHRVREFRLFLGCDNRLAFQHHDENHGHTHPDSKVHGAYMGPTWGRQAPGGPHIGPTNLAIWPLQLEKLTLSSSANSTWDQCWWFSFWCLCANMWRRRRWSKVSLGHVLIDIQLLLNIVGSCRQRHSVPPWSWMLRGNSFAWWYREG